MKYIQKQEPPPSFLKWVAENKGLPTFKFDDLPTNVKTDLKKSFMIEQARLCAYTMSSIIEGKAFLDAEGNSQPSFMAHIEHIKPQNVCREEKSNEDVAYENMVFCVPKDGGDMSLGYGAPYKRGWWDENKFVSPLKPECEQIFSFNFKGEIFSTTPEDPRAKDTIDILQLNVDALKELRKRAIRAALGLSPRSRPLSDLGVQRLIEQIKRNENRSEFCIAIKHAAQEYLNKREKEKRSQHFARLQRNK